MKNELREPFVAIIIIICSLFGTAIIHTLFRNAMVSTITLISSIVISLVIIAFMLESEW